MTNKFIKQYNYAEMSVLVKSIKVTNGENKDNIPLQVSPKGGGGAGHDTFCELEGSTWYSLGTGGEHVIQPGNWRRARDAVWELEGSTWFSLGTGGVHVIQPENWRGHVMQVTHHKT